MSKRKNTLVIIFLILSIILISSGVAGTIAKKPTEETPPGVEDVLPDDNTGDNTETPGDNTGDNSTDVENPDTGNEGTETPEEPEEPELLTQVELTLDSVAYENSSGVDSGKYKSIVTMADVSIANDNIDGNVLKLQWRSGNTVSIIIDLSEYNIDNATHLTFWLGSDLLNFNDGWAKFVQTPSKTIFSSGKYFKSSDLNLEDYFISNPDMNPDDILKFGEWKKFEVPIADVLEFYEENGRITLFHFMSSGLTVNNLYVGNVQFENLAQ